MVDWDICGFVVVKEVVKAKVVKVVVVQLVHPRLRFCVTNKKPNVRVTQNNLIANSIAILVLALELMQSSV